MRALSASNLLDIWERGVGRTPVEQALAILGPAFPQASIEMLGRLDVAKRDRCLLHLRGLTFGPQIRGVTDCPVCGQRLEMDFDARALPASTSQLPDFESGESLNPESSLQVDEYELIFRLPNSIDLSSLNLLADAGSQRKQLIEACVVAVRREGVSFATGEVSASALEILLDRISQENPLADLTLSVTCPACSHTWEIIFDIVSYFWSEIQAWSARLMHEVHTLAFTYGWREADILEMSAWRRRQYLELIGVR
jgi:hypothetical protein